MADHSSSKEHFVGVDLAGARMLAGVFNASLQFLGKAKLSPKPERGSSSVIERLVRCIRDAMDECDLTLGHVTAIGLAVPGAVDPGAGVVLDAPGLGWQNLALGPELEHRLQRPVFLENDCNAASLAVYAQELESRPRNLVTVFLERPSAVGLIVDGRFGSEITHNIPIAVPELRYDPGNPSLRNPAKRLRKAANAGDPEAEQKIHALAEQAGRFVAEVIRLFQPDVLALAGGAIEELKEWFLPVILKSVREQVPPEFGDGVEIFVSDLGRDTGILGAAVLAAQSWARAAASVPGRDDSALLTSTAAS